MEQLDLFELLQKTFGAEKVLEHVKTGDDKKGYRDPFILVKTDALVEICQFLHDNDKLCFDMLHCISAVEQAECFESVYHIYSMSLRHRIVLKVRVEKDSPIVPSVSSIWRAANWHEREAYDLMGVSYEGHPSLTRILCPDEWEGHPLRKDYQMPDHDHLREIGL